MRQALPLQANVALCASNRSLVRSVPDCALKLQRYGLRACKLSGFISVPSSSHSCSHTARHQRAAQAPPPHPPATAPVRARRGTIFAHLTTAIAPVVSFAAAWWAAMQGSHHRDNSVPARFTFTTTRLRNPMALAAASTGFLHRPQAAFLRAAPFVEGRRARLLRRFGRNLFSSKVSTAFSSGGSPRRGRAFPFAWTTGSAPSR